MRLTKEKIAKILSREIEVSETTCKEIISTIMKIFKKALVEGNEIMLSGIGTLKVKEVAARSGEIRGKKYNSEASKSVKLVASDVIRRELN